MREGGRKFLLTCRENQLETCPRVGVTVHVMQYSEYRSARKHNDRLMFVFTFQLAVPFRR